MPLEPKPSRPPTRRPSPRVESVGAFQAHAPSRAVIEHGRHAGRLSLSTHVATIPIVIPCRPNKGAYLASPSRNWLLKPAAFPSCHVNPACKHSLGLKRAALASSHVMPPALSSRRNVGYPSTPIATPPSRLGQSGVLQWRCGCALGGAGASAGRWWPMALLIARSALSQSTPTHARRPLDSSGQRQRATQALRAPRHLRQPSTRTAATAAPRPHSPTRRPSPRVKSAPHAHAPPAPSWSSMGGAQAGAPSHSLLPSQS